MGACKEIVRRGGGATRRRMDAEQQDRGDEGVCGIKHGTARERDERHMVVGAVRVTAEGEGHTVVVNALSPTLY